MVAVLEQRQQYRGYRIHPRQRIVKLQERQVKTATASMTEQVEEVKAVSLKDQQH